MKYVIEILEAVFAIGCVGSTAVLVLSAVEDVITVLEKDEAPVDPVKEA